MVQERAEAEQIAPGDALIRLVMCPRFVDHESRDHLLLVASHDPGPGPLNGEALCINVMTDLREEGVHRRGRFCVREREIVRIAAVHEAVAMGGIFQSLVELATDQISDGRGRAGPLGAGSALQDPFVLSGQSRGKNQATTR